MGRAENFGSGILDLGSHESRTTDPKSQIPNPKSAETGPGIFDEHHPPELRLIEECVHCGFCLPTCPTYLLWHEEMDSPRGRIYLMKMGREGAASFGHKYVGHFDKCLGCMACVTACPSGVKYDQLIEATRPQLERHYRRPLPERLFRWLIFAMFPHPKRLRAALPMLWIYQRLGLQWLVRRTGLLESLPPHWRAMEALLPSFSISDFRLSIADWSGITAEKIENQKSKIKNPGWRIAAQGTSRLRVGLMLGCVQRIFFDEVNAATARVLAAEGCEVVIPRDQDCCGALMTHAGREVESLAAARKLIDSFERAQVDCVVVNAAGCGSNVKEYGHLLRDDPRYAQRAAAFSAKCKDITELLVELGPRAERKAVPLRVAYQDSCHLQHAQGVRAAPRQLLASIPGLEVVEVAESAICCGSAGVYNLVQPDAGNELGERKARHVLATGADALASGNPGCLLQISSHLRMLGHPLPAFHTIELLDASIRGVMPKAAPAHEMTAMAEKPAA